MKKLLSLLLCVVMVFCITVPTFAADKPIKVRICNYTDINGKWVGEKNIKFDVEPQIIGGRTMVPVRAVAEELGYSVGWNQKEQKVMFQRYIDIDENNKNYYGNFHQLKRAMNLFYRIEGGEKIDNFSSMTYFPPYKGEKSGSIGQAITKNTMKYLAVGDILGRETDAKKYLECYLLVNQNYAFCDLLDTDLGTLRIEYKMDVPPTIVEGRTLIPLRAMAELLGLDVTWDDSNPKYNLVTISA